MRQWIYSKQTWLKEPTKQLKPLYTKSKIKHEHFVLASDMMFAATIMPQSKTLLKHEQNYGVFHHLDLNGILIRCQSKRLRVLVYS